MKLLFWHDVLNAVLSLFCPSMKLGFFFLSRGAVVWSIVIIHCLISYHCTDLKWTVTCFDHGQFFAKTAKTPETVNVHVNGAVMLCLVFGVMWFSVLQGAGQTSFSVSGFWFLVGFYSYSFLVFVVSQCFCLFLSVLPYVGSFSSLCVICTLSHHLHSLLFHVWLVFSCLSVLVCDCPPCLNCLVV